MKIVIAGGSGQLGRILSHSLELQGHDVVVLSRSDRPDPRLVKWNGQTLGDWARVVDGSDAVINLAGRSVNCRYTDEHLKEMYESRVRSTEAIGQAIAVA